MEGLSATDLQIFREKSRAFLCTVRIPLDKLRYEDLLEDPYLTRQEDPENIARLVDDFKPDSSACDRLNPDNHVRALIPRSAIPEGTLTRLRNRTSDDDYPLYTPDNILPFLEGRHRIEAARKCLKGNNRWWVAELYSDDLSLLVKKFLREYDPNSAKFYDGDILRQIRISTIQDDTARREKFLARLSKSKRDCVKRLELLPWEFWDSLDALIPFAGLWPAIFIGTFPRLLNLHCPEEMTRYLRRVKPTLIYIIGENENDWPLIDANTFYRIQGRCPGLSFEDRADLQGRMNARELFPAIQDDNTRSQILERLCTIKHVITTIHTFLEDTKYLEPGTRILKKVLPAKSKGSLSQYFNALHSGQPNVRVQTSEFNFEDRTFSSSHASWVAYRVLWLLALRHFPVMDGQAPRKDIGKPNTWQQGLQYGWSVDLSELAASNGYRRVRRQYRDHKAADISMIEDCVRRLRPSRYYKIDQELMKRKVKLIYEVIGDIPHVETITPAPDLTSDHDNCRPDISDRCGRPRTSALQTDEDYLFFDHIYSTLYDTIPKRYLTSFAITRDFFHSFFGTAEDDLDQPTSFRLPRDNHSGGREVEGGMQGVDDAEEVRMQDVDDAAPPANQRPGPPPPPPHEVPLPASPTRPVENAHSVVTTSGTPPMRNAKSPDRHRRSTRRGRSASPTTPQHRLEQRRERSNSRDKQRKRDLISTRGGNTYTRDSIFPGAVQQLLPAGPSIESTQAATVSSVTPPKQRLRSLDQRRRDRSASPATPLHSLEWRRERSSSHQREKRHRRDSSRPLVEDTSAEDMGIVPWVPPPAGPLVENAHTAISARSRSLNGRRKISPRGRSASPTTPQYRLEQRRERSNSRDRRRERDLISTRGGDTHIRETIFPGATQQLLPAGPSVESTQAATVSSEDVSTEDTEIVLWSPPSAEQLVGKAHAAIASRSRSLDGHRKIVQRDRSASPTIHTHRSERRRERSTSSHRGRRRSRGPGTSRTQVGDTSTEDVEIVPRVPPSQTAAGPLVEHSHSAIIPSASALPAAQPSAAPIFGQEIRDRTFSTLPDIQLSAAPTFMFSEETQDRIVSTLPAAQPAAASMFVFSQETRDGTVSTLPATQPAAASISVLRQEIQGRTVSALSAKPSATPMFISDQEQLIEDITISLQDATRLLFHRRTRTVTRSFMVLSHTGEDRFRVYKADSTDPVSMVNALQLPSKAPTLALASDQAKRLKLTAPKTILEEARAKRLGTALVVSKKNAKKVIRQLEDAENPAEELRHKKPQPSLTVNELVKRDGKPIRILVWDDGAWKTAEKRVTYSQTEERVRYYMLKVRGVRPYDYEGTPLAIEDCFQGSQKDSPPTIYLCRPEQAGSAFASTV